MKTALALTLATAALAVAQTDVSQLEGPNGGLLLFTPVTLIAEGRSIPGPVWSQGRSGNRVALLPLAISDAAAYRLQFEEFHVPSDARVFVYGLDGSGAVVSMFGPYEGTGPMRTGDFRSRIVTGTTAVIEVQSRALIAWPFRLSGVERIGGADLARLRAVNDPGLAEAEAQRKPPRGAVRPCVVRGENHWCTEIDGRLLFEGDIEVPVDGGAETKSSRQAIGITGAQYKWPRGKIPYKIHANMYPDPDSGNPDSRLTEAFAHYANKMPGLLVPWTNQADYIEFKRTEATTCSSSIGNREDGQFVNIADGCSWGSIVHEIAHAAGLFHEQAREDRNNFVTIFWENIDPEFSHNFDRHVNDADDIGAYNFGSIMHYGRFGFSINGEQTMETIPAGIAIGQRTSLSGGDIAGIRKLQCVYTVDPLVVDVPSLGGDHRVNVTTPAYCPWEAKSGALWVTFVDKPAGTGNGDVVLRIPTNRSRDRRTATATIAGRTVTIIQRGAQ